MKIPGRVACGVAALCASAVLAADIVRSGGPYVPTPQTVVNGRVRLKLYKGNVILAGRQSADSLFDQSIATFEDDAGAYNQKDAEGFIKLNALRLRIAANRGRKFL